jgi:hypothetical protein
MTRQREEIMEKARTKRRRRAETNSVRKTARQKNQKQTAVALTEKVVDLAEGAAAQVGEFVKAAARKITRARATRH